MTTLPSGPWAITRQYSAPDTYCPKIIVGPAVINFLQGYHTPEEDAAHKARAEADARLIAEAPAMEVALWRAAEIMAEVVAINGSEAAAECRAEIRAILERIDGRD